MFNVSSFKFLGQRGFTLIEFLIAMAIFGSIMLLFSAFGLDVANFSIFLGQGLEVEQEIQITFIVMGSEIRSAVRSETGSYPVFEAEPDSFTFYSDIGSDGIIERIRYFFDENSFKKGIIIPSGTPPAYDPADETVREVIHNVVSASFSYYDSSYAEEAAPLVFPVTISEIRAVQTTVSADVNPADKVNRVTSSFIVTPRNVRSN